MCVRIFEHILGDFNLYLSIYISLVAKKHTYIYTHALYAQIKAGASNNVCAHSIDDP
jgi:hypothetical protein